MSILSITTDVAGQIAVNPRIVKLVTNDNYTTITGANYLQSAINSGYEFYPTDIFSVVYLPTSSTITTQFFNLSISGNTISLNPISGGVELPATDGNLAAFTGTSGVLEDSGIPFSNVMQSIHEFPLQGSNLIVFDITVGEAALVSGGSVNLVTANNSSSIYKVRQLFLNGHGTSFSGGSGDRLGQITDGTTVFSVIPAATMQALANSAWGVTALPFPASVAINASTAAGANLVFKYSGGTTDYTAGSLVLTGIVEVIVSGL